MSAIPYCPTIPRMTRGGQIQPDEWNAMRAAVLACVLQPGPGYQVRRLPGGVSIELTRAPSAQSAHPFRVYDATTGTSGLVRVNGADGFAGTVNGVVAVIETGEEEYTAINADPAPTLAVTGNGYIYIEQPFAAYAATDAPIVRFAASVPADSATAACRAIAQITGYVAGTAGPPATLARFTISQTVTGSLDVLAVGVDAYTWGLSG